MMKNKGFSRYSRYGFIIGIEIPPDYQTPSQAVTCRSLPIIQTDNTILQSIVNQPRMSEVFIITSAIKRLY